MILGAISKRRAYTLEREGRQLVVKLHGKLQGHWPQVSDLMPADVVAVFHKDLAHQLDWELDNNLVVVDDD